jgi:ABC-type nickel/cobalt efflux system permease component RcnA
MTNLATNSAHASAYLTLLVGFALGLKHATEADHVVAVSTLLGDARGAKHSARVGALWGLGHLLTVLVAGSALVVLRVNFPPTAQWTLELGVALLLVGLGIWTLYRSFRGRYHVHVHQHGSRVHAHLHYHSHGEAGHEHASHVRSSAGGPLLVGMAHGLAGTAALALVVLSSIPSRFVGVLYLLCFGLGALLGMAAFSVLLSVPMSRSGSRSSSLRWLFALRLASGVASSILGAVLAQRAFLSSSFPF